MKVLLKYSIKVIKKNDIKTIILANNNHLNQHIFTTITTF